MILQPADIVLTRGDGLFSRLIRTGSRTWGESRTQVNHVGAVVFPGGIHTAEIIEALSRVQRHALWDQYGPPARDQVAVFRPDCLSSSERSAVVRHLLDYEGRVYGWGKIASHLVDWCLGGAYLARRLTNDDRYPICSWVVAQAYHRGAGVTFGVAPGAAQPDDIWDYCLAHPDEFKLIRRLEVLR